MNFPYIFMGSCPLSLAILRILWANGWKPCGIFTAPPRPKGRHKDISKTPVQEFIEHQNKKWNLSIPIFTPEKLSPKNNPDDFYFYAKEVEKLKPKLFLVASYGLLLPEAFLNLTPLGALNVHPSLLPLYRGSSPVPYTLFSGENPSFSLMKMIKAMDAGPLFHQETFSFISKNPQYLENDILKSYEEQKNHDEPILNKENVFFTPEEWNFLEKNSFQEPLCSTYCSSKNIHEKSFDFKNNVDNQFSPHSSDNDLSSYKEKNEFSLEESYFSSHMIYKSTFELPEFMNTFFLSQFLAHRAGISLLSYLYSIKKTNCLPPLFPQKDENVTFGPKLTKDQGYLHWNQEAHSIQQQTLGLNPWPKTRCTWIKEININNHAIELRPLSHEEEKKGDITLIFSSGFALSEKDIQELWISSGNSLEDLTLLWEKIENKQNFLGSFYFLEDLWKKGTLCSSSYGQNLLENKGGFGILCEKRSFFIPLDLCLMGKKPITGKIFCHGYNHFLHFFQ